MTILKGLDICVILYQFVIIAATGVSALTVPSFISTEVQLLKRSILFGTKDSCFHLNFLILSVVDFFKYSLAIYM